MYPPFSGEYPPKSPPPSAPPHPYDQPPPPPPPQPQYVTGIPAAHYVVHPQPVNANWSTGLCACCSDVPNCCLTCWCPCVTFGQIAEIIDKGNTPCVVHGAIYAVIQALTCCGCMYSCLYRTKMRSQYGLRESPCDDCLVHGCCEPCALCQEYRELKHRGFDITIGWQGNMERQIYGVQMPPVAPRGMNR